MFRIKSESLDSTINEFGNKKYFIKTFITEINNIKQLSSAELISL